MDTVLNALKCANCREILSQPVTLPCEHSVCKSHTEVDQQQVICSKCGIKHSNKDFFVSEALSDMIAVQLNILDFGIQHKQSVKACEEVKNHLDKNDLILDDSEYFIHESIDELKNKLMLKSEQLKLRIDEITQELIDELDEYEQRCKERLKQSGQQNEEFESLKKEFRDLNEEARTRLKDWTSVLNELRVDEAKWKEIKAECDKTLHELRNKILKFEKELLMNDEFANRKCHVDSFAQADIYNIDSFLLEKASF